MQLDIENDDITTVLKKLQSREAILHKLESISRLGSWEIDLNTQESTWSDMSYEIYGIPKSTPANLELFFSILLPEYKKDAQTRLQNAIQSGEAISFQCQVLHSTGKCIDVLISAQVVYDEDLRPFKLLGTTQDISEQVATKTQAQELSQVMQHSSNEIYIISVETLKYLYVNQGACDALGYNESELLKMHVKDINPKLTNKEILKIRSFLEHQDYILKRTLHKRQDSSTYYVQSYLHKITYHNAPAYVLFDTDVSEIIQLELQYKKQAKVLEYIHDSVISTDKNGLITNWNKGSTTLFEYSEEAIVGKSIAEIYDKNNKYTVEELFIILNTQGNLDIEAYMLKQNSPRIICNLSLSVSRDENDNVDGYIGYIQDITAQKKTEELLKQQTELLQKQAHYDILTGLPNRALFKDRLSQAIISSKRNHAKFALFFIDLDQFKQINDSLGHHIGDEVLIQAAKRLNSVIREEDTLARLGGDEFTIILKDLQSMQSTSIVAKKIVDIMKEPIQIRTHNLYVTASIGISIYPEDATSDDNLIKFADVAMYKAKDAGRNNFQFYSADMTSQAFERVVLESSLRLAIKEEQFLVHYQPQYDTKTDKIIGMEALVRWNHPTIGLIPPLNFIPLAEETGLIIEIDKLVMSIAMKQFSLWYKQGFNPGVLSLNLAMKQLNEENFLTILLDTMKIIAFKTEWLELEVTEGQVMKNPESSIIKLNQIHDLGIEIAIDDFGTGYSSLSYLKKLPLDKIKIDRAFVKDIPEDEDDMAITKAIIALGKSLNLKLIAEGVETQEQKNFLMQNGCELIQGYLYSPPLPAEEIQKVL
ncbi:diguanylate cyclase/phosphodiesterase (GGDEF & EAL domains) with PAS/PAC sensor(s) [hydrothermal vent metagenome]|uniref:Diguanylate cyclase/phosphodiesterase (GGDEF & EAL domains) with PAS/PAC sensor(S) n=1 Tax=hydrothermal vent metagenome TaxID=652676 RepID=A0A1W1B9P5_9ZZZZ